MPKKILIVDDDNVLRAILAGAFQSSGFEATVVGDGQEALEKLTGGLLPDVIITGIIMPRLGGFDLFLKLKADPRLEHIPVAIMSHRGLPEDQKKAGEVGAADFILQSVTSPPDIVRRIKIILGELRQFKIVATDQLDGKLLANYLSQQKHVFGTLSKEIIFEIEEDKNSKLFSIKLSSALN